MNALSDLLSMIVIFLAWFFPILIIYFTRRRSAQRREQRGRKEKAPAVPVKQPASPREDDQNFIKRIMELQGITPDVPLQEPVERALHMMDQRPEQQTKPAASVMNEQPVQPLRSRGSAASTLKRIERRYPLAQRAIIYGELLGTPKGLREDL